MMKILIPLIMLISGSGAGIGAAIFLQSDDDQSAQHADEKSDNYDEGSDREYARMNNQFVIPIVHDELVSAMVVMSLSIEVTSGNKEPIFAVEPKLRDAFLQVMFDHANIGGFSGNFTSGTNMNTLRKQLHRSATQIAGDIITDVLIVDIVRQDV